jgi:rubrerythrin
MKKLKKLQRNLDASDDRGQTEEIENITEDTRINNDADHGAPTSIDIEWKQRADALIEKFDNVWRCIECGKSAEDARARWQLKVHVQIHLEGLTHICQECGHTSRTTGGLSNHMYKRHSDLMKSMSSQREVGKDFKCTICGQGSISKKGLEGHMWKKHKGAGVREEGRYKCGICGKGSKTRKGREQHKYKYHKGQRVVSIMTDDDESATDTEDVALQLKEEEIKVETAGLLTKMVLQGNQPTESDLTNLPTPAPAPPPPIRQ